MIDISGYLNNFSSNFAWLYSFLQSLHDSNVTSAQAKKKKKSGKNTDQSFQNTPCLKLKHQNPDHGDLKCKDKGHIFFFSCFTSFFFTFFLFFMFKSYSNFFSQYILDTQIGCFFYFYNQKHQCQQSSFSSIL